MVAARSDLRRLLARLPLAALLLAGPPHAGAAETLVVHEWGTFTSFQDEQGVAISGINVDDEPVPAFVHDAIPGLLTALNDHAPLFRAFDKGFPAADPQVTMRLETPVLYFHPAPGSGPLAVDVRVDFHGGWLTQFYPDAFSTRPGHREGTGFVFAPLSATTLGMLHWSGLEVDEGRVNAPVTASPVWTAPRRVAAANIRTADGEGERFLFYRGVGHLDAPVRTRRDAHGLLSVQPTPGTGAIARYFLVDIRPDGALAYRTVAGTGEASAAAGSERFPDGEYSEGRAAELRQDLARELTGSGLFSDEAAALLTTWDASYFRSPGLRLFFLVPRSWVDAVLPIAIAPRALIERAMIGRIELISPPQRAALARIAAAPASKPGWWDDVLRQRVYEGGPTGWDHFRPGGEQLLHDLSGGPGDFARLRLPVPADYAAYLALGRFRDALVRSRLAADPSGRLRQFASAYGLISRVTPAETLFVTAPDADADKKAGAAVPQATPAR
jgi:hypothetical protein